MKRWLIGLATAAGTGAATMVAQSLSGGDPLSWKGAGIAAAIGAITGVIAFLKTSPPPVEEPAAPVQ